MKNKVIFSRDAKPTYKLLLFLALILLTVSLSSSVLGYKVITFNEHIFTAAAIIIPFRYFLSNLIAEVYGLSMAKKMLWILVFCNILFATICVLVIKLPSPTYWSHQGEFNFVLGNTLRITLSASLGVIIGTMLDIILLSKWKNIFEGRWFVLRSFFSSVFGELTHYMIALTIMYSGILSFNQIVKLITLEYIIQILILLAISPLAQIALFFIKYIEGVDIYERNTSINPFDLSSK